MGSLVNPKPWVPYLNIRDCKQGYCSLYCPQWCYIVFPPPPPIEFPTENRSPINFSPLVIAVIAILASAFLLVSYYAIISKYCVSNDSSQRRGHDPSEGLEENDDQTSLEPWHVANNGLDEALIKSITMCKYKRGHGLIQGTDCSVCLSEFEEDENVRLLPKCSHAFHVFCIDTWLMSHSNCPLCRANIVSIGLPPPPTLPPVSELPHNIDSSSENTGTTTGVEENSRNEEHKDIVIEIRDESFKQIRRSLSMDFDYGEKLSIVDLFLINKNADFDAGSSSQNDGVGSSKAKLSETNKLKNTETGLHRVDGPFSMRRSFSSGRFSFSKRGRGRNSIIPL